MLVFLKHITLYCILFYTNAQGQNEIDKYKLNGKIKSIGVFSYNFQSENTGAFIKSSLIELDLFGENRITEFDKEGFKIKETQFKSRKNIEQGVYIYDKNHLKNAEVYGDFVKIFKYDDRKNIREEIWCYSKVCKTKYINKYFRNKLMIQKHKIRDDFFEKTIYTYSDKHNKPTKEVLHINSPKSYSEKSYTYNKNQQLTSIIKYNSKRVIEENIHLKYDLKGRLYEKISFFRIFSPNHHGSIYSYNTKNELIKEVHYELDTKQQALKEGRFIRNYEYKYDNQGNWITCNIYQDKYPKYTIERKINYYN